MGFDVVYKLRDLTSLDAYQADWLVLRLVELDTVVHQRNAALQRER